ncbi:MAG: hypothetical protein AABX47_07430 [Nanoarchaeota archaeon]
MLTPGHFFTAYIVSDFFVPNAKDYVWQIFIFSNLVDLDHLLGMLRIFMMSHTDRKNVTIDNIVDWCRTSIHEPIGMLILMALLGTLWLSGIKSPLIPLAAIGIVVHYIVDFLTVHTRPFDPIDRTMVILFCDTVKRRFWVELVWTVIAGILFLLAYYI